MVLVIIGIVLIQINPADRARLINWGESMAGRPWTPVVMIMIQALLFTAALSGGLVFWVVAPFYDPLPATLILVTGTTIGALGAYVVASRIGIRVKSRLMKQRGFRILSRRSDFLTQTALRVLPGFPHAVMNYAGGVLHLPLRNFIAATMIGSLFKWGVYSSAIHGLVEADDIDEMLQPATLLPLLILTLFLIFGGWITRRKQNRQKATDDV